MKIVHVIGSFDPAKGGPQAVVVRLAAAQASLGHDVTIVSYSDPEVEQRSVTATKDIPDFSKVKTLLMPMPDFQEKLLANRSGPLMEPTIKSADFVHIHGVWETILLRAARLAYGSGVPYTVSPCGMLDVWSMSQKPLKKKIALLAGFKQMLDRASFIHALNDDEINLMEPLGIKAPKLIIPNGIFINEVELPAAEVAAPTFASGRPYILFLSRLHYKKGLDILAEAFALVASEFPNIDLVVAGPNDGAQVDFNQRIRTHKLERRVHMVGGIYGTDKIVALHNAACFCLPSRQEGFSVAITEALACGTPVVITDACHFPEVAQFRAGFVGSVDAQSIAEGLRQVLSNPQLAKEMGEAGRTLVLENFTWPKIAEHAVNLYKTEQIHTDQFRGNASLAYPQ